MDEHKEPNLLISVTGGAGTFEVPGELKNNFAKGLCAAAKSANAWIITGGTDAVSKFSDFHNSWSFLITKYDLNGQKSIVPTVRQRMSLKIPTKSL